MSMWEELWFKMYELHIEFRVNGMHAVTQSGLDYEREVIV